MPLLTFPITDTMTKMVLLLLLVTACAASPQSLSGKMFIFPQETNTAYVKLTTSIQDLSAVTVCFRSFTELKRDHSLFSMSLPSADNAFLIFKKAQRDLFHFAVQNELVQPESQDYKLNMWQSICGTWDSSSGLTQMWLNGNPSSFRYTTSGNNINGPISIILGQEQDSYSGGFDATQSLVGMMTDVHMWDYTLSPCDIQGFMEEKHFPEGNVFNWNSAEFQIEGRVLIKDKQQFCQ
ncbi:jeltraxin-like [Cyprinodon tularosa]|uniref:jeltraxin-like n=1 Tax=Cyprinodon tularosa TaxID=77115 RepID=UPI0018E1EFB7|nr:jeltraxin-like [Cyprinodon tularosa]